MAHATALGEASERPLAGLAWSLGVAAFDPPGVLPSLSAVAQGAGVETLILAVGE